MLDFEGKRMVVQFIVWLSGATEAIAFKTPSRERVFIRDEVGFSVADLHNAFGDVVANDSPLRSTTRTTPAETRGATGDAALASKVDGHRG